MLTEEGRAKLDEASRSHLAAIQALFEERYNEEELLQLAQLLERLPSASGAHGDDCGA